ncbi:MAG TPA: hypothetical protein VGO03_07270 [Acidimicrobiia bacterium]
MTVESRRAGRDYSAVMQRPTRRDLARRLPQALVGMVVLGMGTGASVQAKLGVSPWDVLHQGIAQKTGLSFGTVLSLVGLVVLLGWIPLHQRIGIVTVINVAIIGPIAGLTIHHLSTPGALAGRVAVLVSATLAIGVGAGIYIGAALGPGPRDGLMTALTKRGLPVWKVRLSIELTALVAGWLMGGSVGVGTIVLVLACAPITHIALARFHVPIADQVGVHGE